MQAARQNTGSFTGTVVGWMMPGYVQQLGQGVAEEKDVLLSSDSALRPSGWKLSSAREIEADERRSHALADRAASW